MVTAWEASCEFVWTGGLGVQDEDEDMLFVRALQICAKCESMSFLDQMQSKLLHQKNEIK